MILNIFSSIAELLKGIGSFFIETVTTPSGGETYLSNLFIFICLGVFALYAIITWLFVSFSYEALIYKAFDELNAYFYKKPYITNENLIEFNNIMKHVPRGLRTRWQAFMLERDKKASEYITLEDCIERPLKSTSYKNTLKVTGLIYNIFVGIVTLSIFGAYALTDTQSVTKSLYFAIILPLVLLALKYALNLFFTAKYDKMISNIYINFDIFQRGIDKATSTLPEYIDYEVLFTAKEIKNSVPLLQEYIEKRELLQKEQLEKATKSVVNHEQFNFDAAGFSGSTVLTRALRECEIYLNNKGRLEFSIKQEEEKLAGFKMNYESLSKDYVKQLQLSRENLDRLRISAENSTNRIEASSIQKKQKAEMDKQQEIEHNVEVSREKFERESKAVTDQIDKLKTELEEKKKYLEDVIIAEFKTYAEGIYKELKLQTEQENKENFEKINNEKKELLLELQERVIEIDNKNRELSLVRSELNAKCEELYEKAQAIKDITGNIPTKEVKANKGNKNTPQSEKVEPQYDEYGGYYDQKGNYIFKDGSYYDAAGNYYDASGALVSQTEQSKDFVNESDEKGGSFDSEGNYIYADGSYYDAEGTFHPVGEKATKKTKTSKTTKQKSSESKPKTTEPKTKSTESKSKATESEKKVATKTKKTKISNHEIETSLKEIDDQINTLKNKLNTNKKSMENQISKIIDNDDKDDKSDK